MTRALSGRSMAPCRWRYRAVATNLSMLAAALLACGAEEIEQRKAFSVKRDRIERVVVATGTIEPATEVEIRARIPGIIEMIHVLDGDKVALDQPLVEIERELLAAQVREATEQLKAAKVECRYAKRDLKRIDLLYKSSALAEQARDKAATRFELAAAEVGRARANVEILTRQLDYGTIRSPIDGTVLEVLEETGSAVSPVTSVTGGTVILTLAGDSLLHLEGLVDESEFARVAVGQVARVRTEAYAERVFEGRVREISPVGRRIQNITYFEVEIDVTDADAGLLRPRMSGDAEIVTSVEENAIVIPESALRFSRGQVVVDLEPVREINMDTDNEDWVREVEVGVMTGDRAQILSGLSEGERVFLH